MDTNFSIISIPGTHDWNVTAEWYGAERTVFTGDLFTCLGWIRSNA